MEKQELLKLISALQCNHIIMREDYSSHSFSRIGGDPWVPEGFVWPERNGKKMELFFQLDFEELAPYDTDHVFPEKGVVSVFYDIYNMPWGYEKEDADGIKAFYFPDKSKLIETESGEPVADDEDSFFGLFDEDDDGEVNFELDIPEFCLSFDNKNSNIPPEGFQCLFEDMEVPEEDVISAYRELGLPTAVDDEAESDEDFDEEDEEDYMAEDDEVDEIRSLGLAQAVQHGMLIEIENRLKAGVVDHPKDRRDSKSIFEDWVLLINIPCNSETGIHFSISEPGYFSVYIRKSDLEELNFDHLLYSVDIY